MSKELQPNRELAAHVNAAAVSVEETRVVAEVQARILAAKKFPRNEALAYQRIIEACQRKEFCEGATYMFGRGGASVSGLSIRAAEEFARLWGNIDAQIIELSRKNGVSEMKAIAFDLETNVSNSKIFTVEHVRDTRSGRTQLTDARDVYEMNANLGSRRLRACILALLPEWVLDAAEAQIKKTLAGQTDVPLPDRIARMLTLFSNYGITAAHIEARAGKKIGDFFPEDLAEYVAVFNSIKDGMAKASDFFEVKQPQSGVSAALEQLAKKSMQDGAQASETETAEYTEVKQPSRAERLLKAFAPYNVTAETICNYFDAPNLEALTDEDFAEIGRKYSAIKSGSISAADAFDPLYNPPSGTEFAPE